MTCTQTTMAVSAHFSRENVNRIYACSADVSQSWIDVCEIYSFSRFGTMWYGAHVTRILMGNCERMKIREKIPSGMEGFSILFWFVCLVIVC